jgi:hypothetical protein
MLRSSFEAAFFTEIPVVMTSASYKRFGLIDLHQSGVEGAITVGTQWDAPGVIILSSCGIYFCALGKMRHSIANQPNGHSLNLIERFISV